MPAEQSKMPTEEDVARYWTNQLMGASYNMLQTVQASAGKWATALAAFLAAYGTVGFLITPDKIAALPVHGAIEVVLLIAYGLAGALGIGAVILANLAAQGMPKIRHDIITTGQDYRQFVGNAAKRASGQLKMAMKLAACAGILAIAGSASLLIAGVIAANHPDATVVSPQGAYCGQLLNSDGKLTLLLPTGQVVPVAGGALTQVSSCP
jgi:hypothetical protein